MPFDLDVRDADYRKHVPMKVIKFADVVDRIDDVVCSEPLRFTEDPLDAHDTELEAKVEACGAPLRALLEPLVDDFGRLTSEQLQRELWKYEGMVQALQQAMAHAENPPLRGAELLRSLRLEQPQP